MDFIERDLEDIIFNAPVNELRKRGLSSMAYWNDAHTYRQMTIGNYDIADIVQYKRYSEPYYEYNTLCYNSYLDFNVMELKKNLINIDTLLQAIGYCKGILKFIESRNTFDIQSKFTVTLIGKKIDKSNFIYLPDIVNSEDFFLKLYTYDYNYDGIKFIEHDGYSLANNKFNKQLSYSKYIKTEPIFLPKYDETLENIKF